MRIYTHKYEAVWQTDDDVHWHQCSCGDVTDWAYHTYSEWVNVKELDFERVCSVCKHVQSGTATAEEEEPIPDSSDDTYVPEGEDPADTDTDRPDDDKDDDNTETGKRTRKRRIISYEFTIYFYLLVFGGGAAVLAAVTVTVILLVRRKKKKNQAKI